MPLDELTAPLTYERIHSACGVAMRVNLPRTTAGGTSVVEESHQVVLDGLKVLGDFEYRSGEDDGAGIKVNGFSATFFNKKIAEGDFGEVDLPAPLIKGQFAIGQFFLPYDPEQAALAKKLVEDSATENGWSVVGWRYLNTAVDQAVLSDKARESEPSQWQAILVPKTEESFNLERAALNTGIAISSEARTRKMPMHLISFSSKFIVYKGLIHPKKVGLYHQDLLDEDFTATGTEVHGRFSTNTLSKPENAQPCEDIEHNGELNSAPANAAEMHDELHSRGFHGIYPNRDLSDSMQFKADIHNQMAMKDISMIEAFVRLMPPRLSAEELLEEGYSPEVSAMLQCFRLERTGYNGPGLIAASAEGYSIAKLDESGLRPSRWGILEDRDGNREFHAASDDYLTAPEGGRIIKKGHLDPGGMIVVTPEGDILDTKAILEYICSRYHRTNPNFFQELLATTTLSLQVLADHEAAEIVPPATPELHRILYAAGWDKESQEVVRHMAMHGMERVMAMGDDTDPLHSSDDPAHITYLMHQLFAQVSSPSLDSTNEPEDFSLHTSLGPVLESSNTEQVSRDRAKILLLETPILEINDLKQIEQCSDLSAQVLDLSFTIPTDEGDFAATDPATLMTDAIKHLLKAAEDAAAKPGGGILVLSDRLAGPNRALIPDVIAVAAVRKHLENKHLIRNVSIITDTYQAHGPHHGATLLAVGAKSIYPRGAYTKIQQLVEQEPSGEGLTQEHALKNYVKALQKCLLKTMGKMGLNDVNNYINGYFIAALGLDLSSKGEELTENPTLGNIFQRLYSPMKGISLKHIANNVIRRHLQANNPAIDFTLLPHSGFYMPEEHGIKHGYGPVVINAFTEWLKTEEISATLYRIHNILKERLGADSPDFIDHASTIFTATNGFLDPRKKDANGYYPPEYLEEFRTSVAYKKMALAINAYHRKYPTAIRDHLSIKSMDPTALRLFLGLGPEVTPLQTQQDIRSLLYAGSMSQGALTVADPKTPGVLGAHETLTRGMNAIGAKSASGEGGEAPEDLRSKLTSTSSKQIASGRFGISAMQLLCAEEVEIKVAQGAKPGEGGQLPGHKVSVRFAAQRGGLPGTDFISPPPHHDIYSIEDLKQLIHDIKCVNPRANVSVKLVASQGIGTIAIGVAKAGADVINIAGNSGGTGAAQQSSIKHAGFPAELGLAEVDKALRRAKKRDLVKLRVSGGFKTAEDVIIAAILGADLFEFGTTAMITLGCKMQRTCNHSCQPGVTTDGHLYKGDQLNTERYFVNMAAAIQERLQQLGISHLKDLRGRTELLELLDPSVLELYDFSTILDRSGLPTAMSAEELASAQALRQSELLHPTENDLILKIEAFFRATPKGTFISEPITLNTQDLSFGARIAGAFIKHLESHPEAKIIINTIGIAGQSFGFVTPKGMVFNHQGSVQDGAGKSMTGGELIITTPNQRADYRADDNTIAGNAFGYGASGGKIYVNGVAGHRAFVLAKGVTAVIEGAGKRAFEYMTSGTGMILGRVGRGLCASASGGIVFVYDKDRTVKPSPAVHSASGAERVAYEQAIKEMLTEHYRKTGSVKARMILDTFDLSHFNVLIPKAMDKIKTLEGLIDIIKTYQLRESPISIGMRVWLEQKALRILSTGQHPASTIIQLQELLRKNGVFSAELCAELLSKTERFLASDIEDIQALSFSHLSLPSAAPEASASSAAHPRDIGVLIHTKPKILRPMEERLKGGLDEILLDALEHISTYVEALHHNASGCSTCGAQSCAGGDEVGTGCPSGKNINTLNGTLKKIGRIHNGILTKEQWVLLREAFEIQIKKSPFIRYTGAACPAPCQDACTETIPAIGSANPQRDGKHVGKPVHIKEIELYLDQIGRALGWFNGRKEWSEADITALFGGPLAKRIIYDQAIKDFQAPFRRPHPASIRAGKELIIIGSGPAAMQIAFEALRDGLRVRMYEKSDRAGGLLVDGIPAHKFDKDYLKEDFSHLIEMGLELHLNSEVLYDPAKDGFYIKNDSSGLVIARGHNDNQHIALCLGAGNPKDLPPALITAIPGPLQNKVVQAIDFLKAANDVSEQLKALSYPTDHTAQKFISERFGHMNPMGKKIVIIGGGDTAQDVTRILARYFSLDIEQSKGYLTIAIRGPRPVETRGIADSYPHASKTPTPENRLRSQEVEWVNGDAMHLVEPTNITTDASGKLQLTMTETKFKYHDQIEADATLRALSDSLPREARPRDLDSTVVKEIADVDMIICALGFQGRNSIPLIQGIEAAGLTNVSIAGDAANVKPQIIVGAQASGHDTYQNRIREAFGIYDENPPLSKPTRTFSGLQYHSIFAGARQGMVHRAAEASAFVAGQTELIPGF